MQDYILTSLEDDIEQYLTPRERDLYQNLRRTSYFNSISEAVIPMSLDDYIVILPMKTEVELEVENLEDRMDFDFLLVFRKTDRGVDILDKYVIADF